MSSLGKLARSWITYWQSLARSVTANSHLEGICDLGLPLTDAFQDIQSAEVTLDQDGTWLILGVFAFVNIGPAENDAYGALLVNGIAQTGFAQLGGNGTGDLLDGTASMHWTYDNSGTNIAKLQAKTNATGAGHLNPDSTKITAIFLHP